MRLRIADCREKAQKAQKGISLLRILCLLAAKNSFNLCFILWTPQSRLDSGFRRRAPPQPAVRAHPALILVAIRLYVSRAHG